MSDIKHSERVVANFHQSFASGHDDLNRARQAAEALFAPRRQIENPTNLDATGTAHQDQRKPRILSAVREQQPQAAAHVESHRLKHETRRPRKRVPVSHLARARTWLKYGMTIGQAADIYGVSESEIERILQKA